MTDPEPALPEDSLVEVAEQLYGLDLADFVRQRSARAAAARAGGAKDVGRRISRLLVPTVSAWAINQLVRAQPELVGEIREVGALLRDAQQRLDGAALRELRPRRDRLLGDVIDATAAVVAARGRTLSATALGEVRESIVAALADEEAASAVCGGRLVRAVSYAGFGALPATPPDSATSEISAHSEVSATSEVSAHSMDSPSIPTRTSSRASSHTSSTESAPFSPDRAARRRAAKRRAAERQAEVTRRRTEEATRRVEQARSHLEATDQALTAASLAEAKARRDVERAAARIVELRSVLTAAEEELAALRDEVTEAEDERALAATALAAARSALETAESTEAAVRDAIAR